MPHYKATNTVGGEVVEYDADAPQPQHLAAPWVVENVLVQASPQDIAPPPSVYGGRRTLSRLEFLRLFTPQERIAIRTAATQSPVLADFMQMLELADDVHLDSADTATGVTLLEQAALIGAGRASEVLRG